MQRVGLTGGIGSGKTTVADLLAERGAVIVDADVLAREAVATGSEGLAAVVRHFGADVLTATGELDRPALGAIIFADDAARAALNAIVHPYVRDRAAALRADALATDPDAVVVEVIPLLVETGQASSFDRIIVVDVPVDVQVARVRTRSGLSDAEARARIAAQASRRERLALATDVVDNSGDVRSLGRAVDGLWETLRTPVR
ncbi:MAG: dephospho-CoA kinase [Propioniciclava sp.]